MCKRRVNKFGIVLAVTVVILAVPAFGQQLTLNNAGFDQTPIGDGGWGGIPAEWNGAGYAHEQNLTTTAINPAAQSGENTCGLNEDSWISQVPQDGGSPVLVAANKTYKVYVWAGRRTGNEGTYGGILEVYLQESATSTRIDEVTYDLDPQPKNSWTYQTFYLATGASPNGVGSELQLGLMDNGDPPVPQHWYNQVVIDDVSIIDCGPIAINPSPADESVIPSTSVSLQWQAGPFAAQHDVYLGTDFNDVNEATDPNVLPGRGRQAANSYPDSGLIPGTTYYWRIDEVNGTPDYTVYKGDVWSFTVLPPTAYNPFPTDEAIFVDPNVELSWTAGMGALEHDVYLGTSWTDVNEGGDTYKDTVDVNYYAPSLPLEFNTTYYWRIDEDDGSTTHKGDVWSFKAIPEIPPPPDPCLVGWWKLDDGEGSGALDSSGRGNHGEIIGDPNWVEGKSGSALELNGDDYIECGSAPSLDINDAITLAAWIKPNDAGNGEDNPYIAKGDTSYMLRHGTNNNIEFFVYDGSAWYIVGFPVDSSFNGRWHHVAGTYDGNEVKLYVDGGAPRDMVVYVGSIASNTFGVNIGRDAEQTWQWYDGVIDDVRIYNRALTEEEIGLVMRVDPLIAWNPLPANGSTTDIVRAKSLSWSPGEMANKHDVYFGTDANAVEDATDPNVLPGRGRQDANTYTPPEDIQRNQTYYWRIDEYNTDTTITKGVLWSFTTIDYIMVDNFDRYLTRDDVRDMWKDGYVEGDTGSNITVSTAIDPRYYSEDPWYRSGVEPPGPTHEDTTNALQFAYDNDAFVCLYLPDELGECDWCLYYYSEMEATMDALDAPSDWIADGAKALSLQFYGDPCNSVIGDANQMYIAIEDGDEDVAIVKYGSDATYEDMSDLKKSMWQEWNIDLQRFVNNNASIDLNDVNKVYIGFGIRGNQTTPGGYGIVYLDSIRLYLPRCVPERATDDLSGDCIISFEDFVIMADGWLCGAEGSPDSNLIGQWKFDEASGTTANDSIGDNNGTVLGGAAMDGSGQLILDGVDDYVDLPVGSLVSTLDECSFAAWVDWPGTGGDWQRLFDFGHPNEPNLADLNEVTNPQKYTFSTPSPFRFVISLEGPGDPPEQIAYGTPGTISSGLHCVVATVDVNDANENNTILSLYLDGRLVGRNTDANLVPSDLGNTPNNWLGRSLYAVDPYLIGSYDEFRIYNRVLSEVEVAQLYCSTLARPRADLNNDGVVDFKDMAMLINKWLKETLWP